MIKLYLKVITLLKELLAKLQAQAQLKPSKFIIVHHTGGSGADPMADTSHHKVSTVNNWHKHIGFPISKLGYYVGYTYFIDKTGLVTQCRMHSERGCHTIGYNDCIGICLAGNFDATLPSKEQTEALRELLLRIGKNSIIVPHRKFAPHKSCYGSKLSDTWAADLIK